MSELVSILLIGLAVYGLWYFAKRRDASKPASSSKKPGAKKGEPPLD